MGNPAMKGGRPVTKRIVLAEDDPLILKTTKLRLEHAGFEVVPATDGEEALRRAAGHGVIDLFLLDVKLPKLDGYEVCQRLKHDPATAKTPIIIVTGSAAHLVHLANRCRELGVTDWLVKPFRSEELIETVRRALGEAGGAHV